MLKYRRKGNNVLGWQKWTCLVSILHILELHIEFPILSERRTATDHEPTFRFLYERGREKSGC